MGLLLLLQHRRTAQRIYSLLTLTAAANIWGSHASPLGPPSPPYTTERGFGFIKEIAKLYGKLSQQTCHTKVTTQRKHETSDMPLFIMFLFFSNHIKVDCIIAPVCERKV